MSSEEKGKSRDRRSFTQVEGIPRRLALKRQLAADLFMTFLEIMDTRPEGMSLDDMALYAFVMSNQAKGRETHVKLIPEALRLSPASVSRKMNKLVAAGYLQRRIEGRVHYYTIPKETENKYLVYKDGTPVIEDIYDKIIDIVAEMVES